VSERTARPTADAVIALMALALAVDIGMKIWNGGFGGENAGDLFFVPVIVLGLALYAWIGRLIVTRQPQNTIGWLLLAIPLAASLALVNGEYATRALVLDPGSLPFGVASAWLDRWAIVVALEMFVPIFLLYPDGRLPSPRWRWIGIMTIAAPIVTVVAFAVTPGRLTGAFADLASARVLNPLGIGSPGGVIDTLTLAGGFATLLTAFAAGLAIVVRFRHADPDVRQQIRWLAFIALAFVLWFVLTMALGDNETFGNITFSLMFITLVVGIPVACAVAILRYRLYDLDVVIRKTLVYAILAGFITLVYVGIVVGIGSLVSRDLVLSVVATAVVAVAFHPVRERATRLANRLVYGKRATPYEVLSRFSERVGATYAIEDVLPRTARVIAEGTGAERVEVWLHVGERWRRSAAWPGDDDTPAEIPAGGEDLPAFDGAERAVPVRHQGALLGAVIVRKPPSEPLTPGESKLLDDLAGQAGLVLSNARLTAELQVRLGEISARADELRASRQRIVAAQDAERRRLERNIHDGAQQHLVALAVKLRLTRSILEEDPAKGARTLLEIRGQVADAAETLSALALGIYPPVLEERGLAAALEAQARLGSVPVAVDNGGAGRAPIELEAAVYFVCLEALQNAAKYANPSRVEIRLRREDDEMRFEVTDDGAGFDPAANDGGTGLQGMRDRLAVFGGTLDVRSAPGRGTTVRGSVPLTHEEART